MRVLLVEDEYPDRLVALKMIDKAFPGVPVDVLKTEQEFQRWMESPSNDLPALVVLDIKLRWSIPSPEAGTDTRLDCNAAGIRCLQLLRASEAHRLIPVILLTNKEEVVCPPEASACISKMESDAFIEQARRLLEKTRTARGSE